MTRFGAMRRLATGGCLPGRSPCAGFTAPRRGRSTARPLSARRKPAPVLPPPWSPREVIKDRATAGPGGLSGATALRLPLRRPRRCTHATACRPGTHQNLGALGTSVSSSRSAGWRDRQAWRPDSVRGGHLNRRCTRRAAWLGSYVAGGATCRLGHLAVGGHEGVGPSAAAGGEGTALWPAVGRRREVGALRVGGRRNWIRVRHTRRVRHTALCVCRGVHCPHRMLRVLWRLWPGHKHAVLRRRDGAARLNAVPRLHLAAAAVHHRDRRVVLHMRSAASLHAPLLAAAVRRLCHTDARKTVTQTPSPTHHTARSAIPWSHMDKSERTLVVSCMCQWRGGEGRGGGAGLPARSSLRCRYPATRSAAG